MYPGTVPPPRGRLSLPPKPRPYKKIPQTLDTFTSQSYLNLIKEQTPENTQSEKDEKIVKSFKSYEKQIKTLKLSMALQDMIIQREKILKGFVRINQHSCDQNVGPEPYTAVQVEELKKLQEKSQDPINSKQLNILVSDKLQSEEKEQIQFIETIKQEFYHEHLQEIQTISTLSNTLKLKIHHDMNAGLQSIKKEVNRLQVQYEFKANQHIRNSILLSTFMLLNYKALQQQYWCFRMLIKHSEAKKEEQNIQQRLKVKGKMLLALKGYPNMTKKEAFYHWFIKTTERGEQLILKAAHNLVLHTTINKSTAFYRLLMAVRELHPPVSPSTKRLTIMLNAYTRLYFQRNKKDAFDLLLMKAQGKSPQLVSTQKLLKSSNSKQLKAFMIWFRKNQKLKIQQEQLNKKKTEVGRRILEATAKKMKKITVIWKRQLDQSSRVEEIKKKFISALLASKAGRVAQAFTLIRYLPERKSNEISGKQATKGQKFISRLLNFMKIRKQQSFSSFRFYHEKGNACKKQALVVMTYQTMNKSKKMFMRWIKLCEERKLLNRCKQMSRTFQKINFIIKSVTDNALISQKDSQIKQKCIEKIFSNLSLGVLGSFERWRKLNNVQKLISDKQLTKKSLVAEKLIRASNNRMKLSVKIWRGWVEKYRKVNLIKLKFMNQLLSSKAGRVIQAFYKIRYLPGDGKKDRIKAIKFERNLSVFLNRMIRLTWLPFVNVRDNAQVMKKRVILQMIEATSNKQKKYYNRWIRATEKTRLLKQCTTLTNSFMMINYSIRSVVSNAFSLNKQNALKEKYLGKLFGNLSLGLQSSFMLWRQIIKNQKYSQSISSLHRNHLASKLLYSANNKMKNSLILWKKSASHQKHIHLRQINILKKMLLTRVGRVATAFLLMKSIPQTKRSKNEARGSKFEQGLLSFIKSSLKLTWEPFTLLQQQAQVIKKRAVFQLISMSGDRRKSFYSRWLRITEKQKMLNECKVLGKCFMNLHFSIKSVSDNAFSFDKANLIKEKCLIKIFANLSVSVQSAFRHWQKVTEIQKRSSHFELTNKLKVAELLLKASTNRMLNSIKIWRNYLNHSRKIEQIKINFVNRLLLSRAGRLKYAFILLKTIPTNKNAKDSSKGIKFERGLKEFILKFLRESFDPFKKNNEEAQTIKKRSVIQLINITGDSQRRMYRRWQRITEKEKLIRECRALSRNFADLNVVIKSITDNAFLSTKDALIKEKCLMKLFANLSLGLEQSFIHWRQVTRNNKMQQKYESTSKNQTAKRLIQASQLKMKASVKIWKSILERHQRAKSIRINFIKRLMMSRAGRVAQAFLLMRSIPGSKQVFDKTKGMKFEKGLVSFLKKYLGLTFVQFRDNNSEAEIYKKRAVIQLIQITANRQKKYYNKWKELAATHKITTKCKTLGSAFSILHFAAKSVVDIAFSSNKDSALKEKYLLKLINSLSIGLEASFSIWRQATRQHRFNTEINLLSKGQVASRLLSAAANRMKKSIIIWRQFVSRQKRIDNIRLNFLRRLLLSKAGRVAEAFLFFKTIPGNKEVVDRSKGIKFESGLFNYIRAVLIPCYEKLKNMNVQAQILKKRVLIQLISVTCDRQKKYYNKWRNLTEKTKMVKECRILGKFFSTINFTIKSVIDNAFLQSKDEAIKENALRWLFGNLSLGLQASFVKWRQISQIQKYRGNLHQFTRKQIGGRLIAAANNRMKLSIAIWRSSLQKYRKTKSIQLNFLRRLLLSRAGRVAEAFLIIKSILGSKVAVDRSKGTKFEKGLNLFILKNLKETFEPFRKIHQEAQVMKKRAVIRLVNSTSSRQSSIYHRWIQLTKMQIILKRCCGLSSLFETCRKVTIKNYSLILKHYVAIDLQKQVKKQQKQEIPEQKSPTFPQKSPKYSLYMLTKVYKYFEKVVQARRTTIKTALDKFKSIQQKKVRVNPWFKKSSSILAMNSRINVQKSYWRIKYNTTTSGITFNASVIVKMKKLFNHVKKIYTMNLYKSFLTIENHSKNNSTQFSYAADESGSELGHPHYDSVLEALDWVERPHHKISADRLIQSNKKLAGIMIDRIFSRLQRAKMGEAYCRFFPQNRLKVLAHEFSRENPKKYLQLSKVGAAESIAKISQKYILKTKWHCFLKLWKITLTNAREQSLKYEYLSEKNEKNEQRLVSIQTETHSHNFTQTNPKETIYSENQMSLKNQSGIRNYVSESDSEAIMNELINYKEQNQYLVGQIQNRERSLREANEAITVLSLRINYMITHKFHQTIERVYEDACFKLMNQAFDSIMDEANQHYESEHPN